MSGNWRTRHLRIKAEGLTEAITKQLTGRSVQRMTEGLQMKNGEDQQRLAQALAVVIGMGCGTG